MKTSKFVVVVAAVAAGFSFLSLQDAEAHCQIPCGIFDDAARFASMREHVVTIEKSMLQVIAASAEVKTQSNQLVRWVANKDTHADELTEIVTYYFLAQRIKVPADMKDEAAVTKYQNDLALLHQIMVHSMKSKQTTDVTHTKKLLELIGKFEESYMGKKGAAALEFKKLPFTKRLEKLKA